jgi:rhamnose utilization protein RhaD (predicted bifunctional aldolase and dehydrogenase)
MMKKSVVKYCAAIGQNPLLVQGAGGNASWKEGNTLWIKASGTWLADAAEKNIFVPVDLNHLKHEINAGKFNVSPNLLTASNLRPSIETILHALMPHPVVLHLHAVEILAHLVRSGYEQTLSNLLDSKVQWGNVAYFKPGAELASAVRDALIKTPDADVVLLQNHGVVIGGADVNAIDTILNRLVDTFRDVPPPISDIPPHTRNITLAGRKTYVPVPDNHIQQLATNIALFDRLKTDWVLYPDHAVFLGPVARAYDCVTDLEKTLHNAVDLPELFFVRGLGVFMQPEFSMAKQVQLRCYHDVLSRQDAHTVLNALNQDQIAALLNWDAEKHRMNIAK